jgi:hypothetical protein
MSFRLRSQSTPANQQVGARSRRGRRSRPDARSAGKISRKIEEDLGHEGAITRAASKVREFVHNLDAEYEPDRIRAAIREVYSPLEALRATRDAIARGNKKVFEEIAPEFARFLASLTDRTIGRASPNPLEHAFAAYAEMLHETQPKAKAEWMLLGNLRIGLYEQTGLQSDILEALNAPIPEPQELKERLLDALLRRAGPLTRMRVEAARHLGRTTLIEQAAAELAEAFRGHLRRIITEELITLELPRGNVRPGLDIRQGFPDTLRTIENTELRSLLASIDPTSDSLRESAARDWADLNERMHFIADFFRAHQEDVSLFEPPFTREEIEAIEAGRTPPEA